MAFLSEFQFTNEVLLSLAVLLFASIVVAAVNGLVLMVDSAYTSVPEEEVNGLAETDSRFTALQGFLKNREKVITSILTLAEIVPFIGGAQIQRIQHNIPLTHFQEIVVEVISILLIIQIAAVFKSLGYKYAKDVAVNAVLVLKIVSTVISPVSSTIEKIAHLIVGDLERERFIQESILREDLERAEELEIIDKIEHGFIANAFQFSENTVASVMTFMNNVFALQSDQKYTLDELIVMFDAAHSRVPIVNYKNLTNECSEYILTKEFLLGLLSVVKDLPEQFTFLELVALVERSKYKNRISLYKAATISEDESISTVLESFTTKQISEKSSNYASLAVVHHEQSGMLLGIVTLTDLLQELVGSPLYDEDDVEPKVVGLLQAA